MARSEIRLCKTAERCAVMDRLGSALVLSFASSLVFALGFCGEHGRSTSLSHRRDAIMGWSACTVCMRPFRDGVLCPEFVGPTNAYCANRYCAVSFVVGHAPLSGEHGSKGIEMMPHPCDSWERV